MTLSREMWDGRWRCEVKVCDLLLLLLAEYDVGRVASSITPLNETLFPVERLTREGGVIFGFPVDESIAASVLPRMREGGDIFGLVPGVDPDVVPVAAAAAEEAAFVAGG